MTAGLLHATAVALWTPGGWRGALLSGRSGAGKSDLALRLIGRGWRLVGDDYIHVFASSGRLYAAAPPTIAGRLEARHVGVVDVCTNGPTRLVLAVELADTGLERLPEPATRVFAGVELPLFRLNGFEPSAAEKVTLLTARL